MTVSTLYPVPLAMTDGNASFLNSAAAAIDKINTPVPNLNSAEFTMPGTFTLTVPAGINQIWVDGCSGGGGGGGSAALGGGGGGGGGSPWSLQLPMKLPAGTTALVITVGATGAGGLAGMPGHDGGQTTILATSAAGPFLMQWPAGQGGGAGTPTLSGSGAANATYAIGPASGVTGSSNGNHGNGLMVPPSWFVPGSSGGSGGGYDGTRGGNGGSSGFSCLGSANVAGGAGGVGGAGGGAGGLAFGVYNPNGSGYQGIGGSGYPSPTPGVSCPTQFGQGGGGGGTGQVGGAGGPGYARICW